MSKIYDKYLELKKVDSDKLYLFKSGKFYIFIADDCELINDYVVLKKVKFTNEVYKCGFPENVLDNYLRVFKNHNLDIVVIEKIDDSEKKDDSDIKKFIGDIDIDNITPIQALLKLKEIKEMLYEK